MNEIQLNYPTIECCKCGIDFHDGDTVFTKDNWVTEDELFTQSYDEIYCEECAQIEFCEDCGQEMDACECLD